MENSTYMAVDPGTTGCLAVMDADAGYIDHLPMPVTRLGRRKRVNGAAIRSWMDQWDIRHAFVERVQSMPRQGVASTFTFGHSAGLVEGVITGAGIPLTLVAPQQWKRHAGLIGSDKDSARARAVQLYPGLRSLDAKAKGQALADALMIGRYGVAVCQIAV